MYPLPKPIQAVLFIGIMTGILPALFVWGLYVVLGLPW